MKGLKMFSRNLKIYRKTQKLTQGELAKLLTEKTGKIYTDKNVQSWENKTNPKLEIIISLSDILGIPEQYLINDSTDKINKIVNNEIPNFKNVLEHTKKVNLIDGYAGAGSSGEIESINIINHLYIDNSVIKKEYRGQEIKALTVIGDSMFPYVSCQDVVLFWWWGITRANMCLPDDVEQFCCHLGSSCTTELPDPADAALGRFWVGATAPGPLTESQALLAQSVLAQNMVALCNKKHYSNTSD